MKKIKELYKRYKEIINYIIFGALTTLISLIVYYLCVYTVLNPLDPIQLQIANVISWIVSVLFAYVTNKKYVFENKDTNKVKQVSKFFLSRLITLVMDMLIMYVGVTLLSFSDKVIKIIAQVIVIVANYVFSKLVVFKK